MAAPSMPGPMPSSFDDDGDFRNETGKQKIFRKIKEEPLVPLGIGLTVLAFVNAYRALRRGDSRQANRMFRARVAAQGFTIVAMVAGSMYYSRDREKTAELRKLQEQKLAEEKRQRWIRELEARDDEEKALKARLQRRKAIATEEANAEKEAVKDKTAGAGTGGVLASMGLWSKGEEKAIEEVKAAEAEAKAAAAAVEKKAKSPNSSLGALGELMSKKKGSAGDKSGEGSDKDQK